MMKKVFSLLLCLTLLCACCVPGFAEGEAEPAADGGTAVIELPNITNSRMAILYEESTDTLLYALNADRGNAPASMTKVMTAVLVLEYDPELKGKTVVSPMAISEKYCYWMDDVHLLSGEEITVKDLMDYLLIPSGNEAATTLAEYVAGDIDTFIDMMNAKAKELGMEHTHYFDPHGLSDESRVTCEDQLILIRYAMSIPAFRAIVGKDHGVLPASNKRSQLYRYNTTNRLMSPRNKLAYETGFANDIKGIKTGSTTAAGLNFSCCMEYNDMTFYSVTMKAKDVTVDGESASGHMIDTKTLMKFARTFHKQTVGADYDLTVSTTGSTKPNLPVRPAEELSILVQEDIVPDIKLNSMKPKVKAGDVVGVITLTDPFGNVRSSDLVAQCDASTNLLPYCGLLAVLVAVFVLLVRSKAKKAKKQQENA